MLYRTTIIVWTDYDTVNSSLSEIGYSAENDEHSHVEQFTCEEIHPDACPPDIYTEIYGPTSED